MYVDILEIMAYMERLSVLMAKSFSHIHVFHNALRFQSCNDFLPIPCDLSKSLSGTDAISTFHQIEGLKT